MRSYFTRAGRSARSGSLGDCVAWAMARHAETGAPVQLFTARPGSVNAILVGEVADGSYRRATVRITTAVKSLVAAARHG